MKFLRKLFNKVKESKAERVKKKKYSYITEFKDGYALAISNSGSVGREIVIINEKYEQVGRTKYEHTVLLNPDGYEYFLAYSSDDERRYQGMLDKNLKEILPAKYQMINYLGNGQFAAVTYSCTTDIYNIKTGTTNEVNGHVVGRYGYAGQYYYEVLIKGLHGYYDDNFKLVIEAEYDYLSVIDDQGRIAFIQDGKHGVIYLQTGKKEFR